MLATIIAIAARDITKFLRDRPRMIATLVFPLVFIGILGQSLQSNLGAVSKFNFLEFVFLGVLGQTWFQSTAAGIISLVEDRESDFAQEIFVAPISRLAIILGKIAGEGVVASLQGIGIVAFALISGIPIDLGRLLLILPAGAIVCFLGGAFGVLVMSRLTGQRGANQIFPFLLFPQFFLAGVFSPISNLPPILFVLSRISPMTYGVDLMRSLYYWGRPEATIVVLHPAWINLAVIGAMIVVMVTLGTRWFVKAERER